MQISVINLASHDARWRAAALQFSSVGLRPSRLEAVEGASLDPATRSLLYGEALNEAQYHKALRAGEIGCYASHLAAWQQLLDSGQAAMAVFEDDVEIDVDLPQVLEAIARLATPFDIVKLIGRSREKIRERTPLLRDRDLIAYRRIPSLTGAYVVTARGAAKLLARRRPFGRPVDVDIRHWWECDLQVLGVNPYPVWGAPSSLDSTIEDRRSRGGVVGRLRKIWLQARYSTLNGFNTALRPRSASIGARPAAGVPGNRPHEWAPGRDAV